MKRILWLILLGAFSFSCEMGSGDSSNPPIDDPPIVDDSLVGSIIGLPDMRMDLPNSLGGNGEGSINVILRAVGDVTELSAEDIDGVKSEAWIEINQRFNNDNPLESNNIELLFLDEIKQFAQERKSLGEDLESGVVYQLGVRDLLDQYNISPTFPNSEDYKVDLGRFRIDESESITEIYWSTPWVLKKYIENAQTGEFTELEETTKLQFYIKVDESNDNKLVTFVMKEQNDFMVSYSFYDKNNQILEHYIQGDGFAHSFFADGNAENLVLFESFSSQNSNWSSIEDKIVFGEDSSGGLISVGSEVSTENETESFARTEYFNSQGDLLLEEWGESDMLPLWTTIDKDESSWNLYDYIGSGPAPQSVTIRGDERTDAWEYSINGGSSWSDLEGIAFSLYWKSGEEWQVGDCEYRWDSHDVTTDYFTINLVKGSSIANPQSFFGAEYHVSMNYPLKSLLPLADPWGTTHVIQQMEGETDSFDLDGDGEDDFTWTYYDFYLVQKEVTLDTDLDFQIHGLQEQSYYTWDILEGEEETKAYTFNTTGSLPEYFEFQEQSLVDRVKSEIEALYSDEYQTWKDKDYAQIHADLMPQAWEFSSLEN